MESNKGKSISDLVLSTSFAKDELANLKKISDINNQICCVFDDLIVCSASECHVKEIAELWANLASIQQISAPDKYSFQREEKDWQSFVRKKLSKKNNLLLVAHKQGDYEVKGFLYLQTITIPSSDLVLKGVMEDIYTKPQHRRLEIASKLLNVAMDWAIGQNIKQVDFISLTNAKDLSGFYLSFLKKLKKDITLELVTL